MENVYKILKQHENIIMYNVYKDIKTLCTYANWQTLYFITEVLNLSFCDILECIESVKFNIPNKNMIIEYNIDNPLSSNFSDSFSIEIGETVSEDDIYKIKNIIKQYVDDKNSMIENDIKKKNEVKQSDEYKEYLVLHEKYKNY